MDFSVRSYQKELLDRDDIPFADIKKNMQELDLINAKLGGHKITLEGIETMITRMGERQKGKHGVNPSFPFASQEREIRQHSVTIRLRSQINGNCSFSSISL